MRPVLSQSVWTLLPASERNAVTEAIVRVLAEVVENERHNQGPIDSPETSGRGLAAAVHSPAGPQELRKRAQSAQPSRPAVRASQAFGLRCETGRAAV
jgi:hypothetical protein